MKCSKCGTEMTEVAYHRHAEGGKFSIFECQCGFMDATMFALLPQGKDEFWNYKTYLKFFKQIDQKLGVIV